MENYDLLEQIGDGGQAEVFRAVRKRDGQELALKRLHSSASDSDRIRFAREVRLQSSLSHPNVMPIVANDVDSLDQPYYVMPLAAGNLHDRVAGLRGNSELACSYFAEILAGVEHAHKNGVIHRDLKPQNILFLEERGQEYPVVSDFGLGRLEKRDTTTLTGSGWLLGTRGYAAPEQFGDSRHSDRRCDIYALGI